MDIYREEIIEHGTNPLHWGKLASANARSKNRNPSCGDYLEVFLDIDSKGVVRKVSFRGDGCAISKASGSLLLDSIVGKNIEEIKNLDSTFLLNLLKIDLSPTRLKCALLPLIGVRRAIEEHENR